MCALKPFFQLPRTDGESYAVLKKVGDKGSEELIILPPSRVVGAAPKKCE